MISFARENIVECHTECDELVREYYASTRAQLQVPPIDFSWPHYIAMESQKQVLLMTARDGDKYHAKHHQLVGFALYIMTYHPHHQTVPMAICDTLAVRPSHRSVGIGRNLLSRAEDLLRDYGMHCIIHMFRAVYAQETTPLFPSLGYVPFEMSYVKQLVD